MVSKENVSNHSKACWLWRIELWELKDGRFVFRCSRRLHLEESASNKC